MNIVQPGSATVNSNARLGPSGVCTRAVRRSPTTGDSTATATSMTSSPGRAAASPAKPSPWMRIGAGSVHPVTATRTSCSGASDGPTKSSVDSAETTRMTAPYGDQSLR
ncbi:Uncharacterised protein [Mycobacterium tuberculosis]|uniref:Uncharacterized protein n=2 Tax=Mycobacterium tuberculosis TaxID=1773 RepID=A0A0T9D9F5_MYCTX|nr:Uncharacterised protein [Mycobacterium tuberculosis]CFA94339.1 Uncharacterised protein [Mycobacterium tuberculosis]CFB07488.1 Uncharacterised protein [Mycobacterium tuberculosis]CFB17436.1 Uncharacterised protein [Mycobacterium tuberculosis]CFB21828.1 Uncharacterised protein [Mycobacterium tuberculosis]